MLQPDLERYANAPAVLVQIYVDRIVLHYPSSTEYLTECAQFSHPRSLLGDFNIAETALTQLLKRGGGGFKYLAPYMFIQAMERMEFGLTQIEIRALQELGLSSGARAIAIYDETGKLLTPNSLPATINLKRLAMMGLIITLFVLLCFLCAIFIF
ncbi:MAG: hypothetical protein BGN93_14810 [Acinetobacter sp. 39-4]|nr:MAG: hypothetical protein BGN93_14810 [Acinetobacter sp. 39-4]